MHRTAIAESATTLVEDYDVRPREIGNTAGTLSGGNAQKMIVAREFSRDVPMVICAQPTRGIDVGANAYIVKSSLNENNLLEAVRRLV